mgnify:FL=1
MKTRNIKDFLNIKNLGEKAELHFYGEIVCDEWEKWSDLDTCPEDVLNYLSKIENSKELDIYINSGGGSVFAGLGIYNILKRHKGRKTVYVDGLAGSIASIIAMVGDEIIVPSNSFIMIHKPLCGVCGNANDMREMADTLDRIEEGLINTYKTKLKDNVDIETIKAMVNVETWLTGEEASKYFNITVTEANKMIAKVDTNLLNSYKNVPENLKTKDINMAEDLAIKNKEIEIALALALALI